MASKSATRPGTAQGRLNVYEDYELRRALARRYGAAAAHPQQSGWRAAERKRKAEPKTEDDRESASERD